MRGYLVAVGCVLLACAGPRPALAPEPGAAPSISQPAAAPQTELWQTRLDADSALVGKIWDVKAGAFSDEASVMQALARARFVLLGERHDNPDHHRLQGRVIAALAAAGRRPAVVLEMLEVEQQPAVDAYWGQAGANAVGFGAALAWEKTSWPPFSEYQPIFEAAFLAKLPVAAGNVAQADVKALVKQGTAALPPERVRELRLAEPFPPSLEAPLLEELRASHCGHLPENFLAPMALAQHARDAQMAKVLLGAGQADGAVLIAGGGHARLDRAVPRYLSLDAPTASLKSLAFREVRHGDVTAQSYTSDEGPFDYVWFTPRGSDEDPCAAFHAPPAK